MVFIEWDEWRHWSYWHSPSLPSSIATHFAYIYIYHGLNICTVEPPENFIYSCIYSTRNSIFALFVCSFRIWWPRIRYGVWPCNVSWCRCGSSMSAISNWWNFASHGVEKGCAATHHFTGHLFIFFFRFYSAAIFFSYISPVSQRWVSHIFLFACAPPHSQQKYTTNLEIVVNLSNQILWTMQWFASISSFSHIFLLVFFFSFIFTVPTRLQGLRGCDWILF